MAGGGLEFRVLGPLEVLDGDRVVPIRAARQRAVLAVLLLDANRLVDRDTLIDKLWGGTPPEASIKSLQSYVSRLRTTLGITSSGAGEPPALTAGPDGRAYRLEIDPERIDSVRCARLVEQGKAALADGAPDRAADAFEAALRLWRDRPLADLARLAERVGDPELAMEGRRDRITTDMELGRKDAVRAELGAFVQAAIELRQPYHRYRAAVSKLPWRWPRGGSPTPRTAPPRHSPSLTAWRPATPPSCGAFSPPRRSCATASWVT